MPWSYRRGHWRRCPSFSAAPNCCAPEQSTPGSRRQRPLHACLLRMAEPSELSLLPFTYRHTSTTYLSVAPSFIDQESKRAQFLMGLFFQKSKYSPPLSFIPLTHIHVHGWMDGEGSVR